MFVLHRAGALKNTARALTVWLLLAIVVQGWLSLGGERLPGAAILTKIKTLCSLDYIHLFALGMLLYKRQTWERTPLVYWLLGGGCLGFRLVFDGVVPTAIVLSLLALLALATSRRASWLNRPKLVFLGTISYPLYLLHQNIGYVVMRAFDAGGLEPHLGVLAALAVAVGLATALTFLIERPALRWIKSLARRWTQRPQLASQPLSNAG
jgi:peptidoglycan/LPS O-acetylase OafA/YrhL